MDISADELERAPDGSYDDIVVTPIETRSPDLGERFDLCVSWFVFEHVKHVDLALGNVFSYLRPGGTAVIQMTGRYSPFSLLNRLLPDRIGEKIVQLTQNRGSEDIFPALYEKCSYRALSRIMRKDGWDAWEVRPLFIGAPYVLFSKPLTAAYVAYEEWAYRRSHANLAPYYLLVGHREAPERGSARLPDASESLAG
jgi:SAM-dependent methyltransferase